MKWDYCDKENIARKIGKVGMCKNTVMDTRAISKVCCVQYHLLSFILLWIMVTLSY